MAQVAKYIGRCHSLQLLSRAETTFGL